MKVRIGFSVALLGLIGICAGIGLTYRPIHHRRLALMCLAVGVIGLLSWIAGQSEGVRKPFTPVNGALFKDRINDEHPLIFLKSLKYWGLMLIFAAGIAYIVPDFAKRAKRTVVRARQKETIPPTSQRAAAPPSVSFPPLKLQGLIFQDSRSSALINGQVLRVGEGVGHVRVVAIGREQVIVALDGQTNVLRLRN